MKNILKVNHSNAELNVLSWIYFDYIGEVAYEM